MYLQYDLPTFEQLDIADFAGFQDKVDQINDRWKELKSKADRIGHAFPALQSVLESDEVSKVVFPGVKRVEPAKGSPLYDEGDSLYSWHIDNLWSVKDSDTINLMSTVDATMYAGLSMEVDDELTDALLAEDDSGDPRKVVITRELSKAFGNLWVEHIENAASVGSVAERLGHPKGIFLRDFIEINGDVEIRQANPFELASGIIANTLHKASFRSNVESVEPKHRLKSFTVTS